MKIYQQNWLCVSEREGDWMEILYQNSYHHQRFHFVNLEQFDIILSTIYLPRNNHRANNFLLQMVLKKWSILLCINVLYCWSESFYCIVSFSLSHSRFPSSPLDILDLWIGHWPNRIMVENTSFIRIFVYLSWAFLPNQ